jgi:hypothetical protein
MIDQVILPPVSRWPVLKVMSTTPIIGHVKVTKKKDGVIGFDLRGLLIQDLVHIVNG